ncbi:MAG: class I SAM-dependent RNA methyltransferase, partial [Candidatus Delongbacteria bacterium]|nr:class I SAM-dependent RNA methyltransferase [Candidatus Delongbacteria bacterium]
TGCTLFNAKYSYQLEIKKNILDGLYGKEIKFIDSDQYAYRNKAVLPIGRRNDEILIGIYRRNSHDIIDYKHNCVVLNKGMNEIIFKIKDLIDNIPDKILPEHLFIRGEKDGFQVGFIVKETSAPIERILSNLYKRNDDITSVFYSISSRTNSLAIIDPVFLNGDKFVKLSTTKGSYKISPSAFFQANIPTLNKILENIGEIISQAKPKRILDLYSGCGVLSDIPGIDRTCAEINSSAFEFIEDNRSKFITSDIAVLSNEIGEGGYDMIIVDPPRKGIDKTSIDAINESNAETIIYLACDPKTQKRDIYLLTNYEILDLKGYDMFPNTMHIETIAVLKRK